jgi:hypothetical protein
VRDRNASEVIRRLDELAGMRASDCSGEQRSLAVIWILCDARIDGAEMAECSCRNSIELFGFGGFSCHLEPLADVGGGRGNLDLDASGSDVAEVGQSRHARKPRRHQLNPGGGRPEERNRLVGAGEGHSGFAHGDPHLSFVAEGNAKEVMSSTIAQ